MDQALARLGERFAIVTLTDGRVPPWCRARDDREHVPVRARRFADRTLLAARIDRAVLDADRAVLLMAEGAGCFAAAWWARLSPSDYVGRVVGALFVEPGERDEARFASPRTRLPFPSMVVAGAPAAALAHGWGSSMVETGEGAFRRAVFAVERFTAAVIKRDVRVGQRAWLGIVR